MSWDSLSPEGYVFVNGERWAAFHDGDVSLQAGQTVRVRAVDGFRLHIEPVDPEPVDE